MTSIQKYMINTLKVDVVTSNTSTAFYLKDHIDSFLKHDILPYLEGYFASIEEDMPSHVIQIPNLSVDVSTPSTLNYHELKEDIKQVITKEIKKKVSKAHSHNEEARLLTSKAGKEETFLQLLEKGVSPWWIKSDELFQLTDENFAELIASKSFLHKLKSKMMNAGFRNRMIQQLSTLQLIRITEKIVYKSLTTMDMKRAIEIDEQLSSSQRKQLLEAYLDYVLHSDVEMFVTRLIFQVFKRIQGMESGIQTVNRTDRSFVKVVLQFLKEHSENRKAQQALVILKKNRVFSELFSDFAIEIDPIQGKVRDSASNDRDAEINTSTQLQENHLKETHEPSEKEIKRAQDIHNGKQHKQEVYNVHNHEGKAFAEQDKKETEHSRQTVEKNKKGLTDEQRENSVSNQSIDTSLEEQKEMTRPFVSKDNEQSLENQTDIDNSESNETQDVNSISHKNSSLDENQPEKEKEISNEGASYKDKQPEGHDLSTIEYSENSKRKEVRVDDEQASDHLEFDEVQESLEKLIGEADRKLFEELDSMSYHQPEFRGEIHVNNAGLILLHPYLKDFFGHCNLLDENNQIIQKDLAVHLLHYLATKQEQQFENNMVFEKVLCGVPIEEPIRRILSLSDELKENAEELLQAVLDNWGALNNASPDLLRGEFLQRFGKISFKEVNPKITVERKVHDILLDKLPWNIGISRLPWLDHLLFTDW